MMLSEVISPRGMSSLRAAEMRASISLVIIAKIIGL
jgi:hypothetical protein